MRRRALLLALVLAGCAVAALGQAAEGAGAVATDATTEDAEAPDVAPTAGNAAAAAPDEEDNADPATPATAQEVDPIAAFLRNFPLPPPNGKPYNVCVPDAALPYAYCLLANEETGVVASADDVIGYEATAVSKLLTEGYLAEWTYGTDWQFMCMGSKDDIIEDLTSDDPTCMVAAMGLDITASNLKQGIRFSYFPTDRAGVSLVTTADVKLGGIWFFLKPFHWSVWVTWIVVTVVMIVVLYICEISPGQSSNRFAKGWPGFVESLINTLLFSWARKGPNLAEVISIPARIMIIFYAFFLMIFLQIYTAQLAGQLAVKNIQASIPSVEAINSGNYYVIYPSDISASVSAAGLQGSPIDTWSYLDVPSAYYWLLDQSVAQSRSAAPDYIQVMFDKNVVDPSDVPDAILIKSSEAKLVTAEYCNIYVVGSPFQTTTQALAFPSNAANSTILAFSVAQAKLQEETAFYDESSINSMINTYKTNNFEAASCPGKSAAKQTTSIKFEQIVGLLVVLAIGVGIASILVVYFCWRPKTREWHRNHFKAMRPRWTRFGGKAKGKTGAAAEQEDVKIELAQAAADGKAAVASKV